MMKLILISDVAELGEEGDIVEVADGYGRNYLLPKRLAVKATEGALEDAERRVQARGQHGRNDRSILFHGGHHASPGRCRALDGTSVAGRRAVCPRPRCPGHSPSPPELDEDGPVP